MVTKFTSNLLENTVVEKQFSQDVGTTTGLTWGMRGGFVVLADTVTTIADSTTVLTDDDTNYIYISLISTPVLAVALSIPGNDAIMLYSIVTASGVISSITPWRTRLTSLNSSTL